MLLAINKLKSGKNDGNAGLSSDHFKNGCAELPVYIAFLFSALLTHGVAPDELVTSTVIPIPKGKGLNPTDSANYRGIALSSIFGKLFDLMVLHRFSDELSTSSLQFGFKANRSTSMCTMVLKEVIAYYTAQGGSMYCTMLDATKAFDRVNYCKLFRELFNRNLPPVYLRLLFNMYTSHITRVSWNGIFSATFTVKNGVKQGGVISPVMFCLYIDSLLLLLKQDGVGCYIGEMFLGALAYADDLVLMAPTPRAMRTMLKLCDDFANRYDIIFNANKSKCLYVAPHVKHSRAVGAKPLFSVGNNTIDFVREWPHLGHIISASCDDKADIISKRNSLCGQINNVLCFFNKRDPITKLSLLRSYCSHHYGCILWDLSQPVVEDFCVVWRKGLRRVWGLPHNAHSALLSPLCGLLPLMDELACRNSLFITKCLTSDSDVVSFVARNGVYFRRMLSPIGCNAIFCCKRYDIMLDDILLLSRKFITSFVSANLDPSVLCTVSVLLELLFVKFSFFSLPQFDRNDIDSLIKSISTM